VTGALTELARVHAFLLGLILKGLDKLGRGIWALVKLPLRVAWNWGNAVMAWMGIEGRRWSAVFVGGLLALGLSTATLKYIPDMPNALMATALVNFVWLFGLLLAVEHTLDNNLYKVRQQQMFRKLSGIEDRLGDRVVDTMARATQGTPIEGAFRSNRADKARAQQHAQAAAEQEAADRQAAAQQAAQQAAEQQRHLDALADAGQPYA
jgi:hypothetical protein